MQVSAELLDLARSGDRYAMSRLLVQVKPDIRRYARSRCHRSSALEDVVQEALLVVYRRVGTVSSVASLGGWLVKVVSRLCMLPALMLMKGVEELAFARAGSHVASVPPDELRLDLLRAFESLPVSLREVVVLRDFQELTVGEIAQRLGLTREATKSRLHRARVLLREFLVGEDGP